MPPSINLTNGWGESFRRAGVEKEDLHSVEVNQQLPFHPSTSHAFWSDECRPANLVWPSYHSDARLLDTNSHSRKKMLHWCNLYGIVSLRPPQYLGAESWKYNLSKVGDHISRLTNYRKAVHTDLEFGCENFSSETKSISLPVAQEHISCAREFLSCVSEVTKSAPIFLVAADLWSRIGFMFSRLRLWFYQSLKRWTASFRCPLKTFRELDSVSLVATSKHNWFSRADSDCSSFKLHADFLECRS